MAAEMNGESSSSTSNPSKPKQRIATVVVDVDKVNAEAEDLSGLIHCFPEEVAQWEALMIPPFGLTAWATDSLEALKLKLVRSAKDLEDDESTFHPQMTYQIFGESEKVVGYKDIEMQLYYTAGSLATYFNVKYDQRYDRPAPMDLQPDDLTSMIGGKLQPGYTTDLTAFMREIEKDADFTPPGTLLNQFSIVADDDSSERTYEIYSADVVSCPEFVSYHERLQTFLLWYIEAASYIDIDDDKWKFYLMFERFQQDGRPRYAIVGYLTVYEFFCYPKNLRPRVSQMLILPPFQSCGLGAQLLETAFTYYRNLPNVTDIAVESPSEEFQRLRDYVDCKVCAKLPSFAPNKLQKGFSKVMEEEAKTQLKMSKKQAQRVCNILRLGLVNEDNPRDFDLYIRCLKSQVDKPHQVMLARAKRKKLFERLSFKRILEAMPSLNDVYREGLLSKATEMMLEQYRLVLERLERD